MRSIHEAVIRAFLVLVMSYNVGQGQKPWSDVSPYCDYLLSQAGGDLYLPNLFSGSPFKIFTKSPTAEITGGSPVQVTIGPFSKSLNFFNFTDFILYATPVSAGEVGPDIRLFLGNSQPHVGVFQLFDKYRAGAGPLSCSPNSRVDDSVGAFEDRLLATFRRHYPNNPILQTYKLPARNQVSVLWWPTNETLTHPEVKFVANIKSMGSWFKLQSTVWRVKQPVDPFTMTENMLNQFQNLENKVNAMERRFDLPI